MTPKTTLAFIVLLALNPSPCPAQGQDPPGAQGPAPASEDQQPPTFRRWSITAGLGDTSRWPAGDLEAAMRAGGFGDPMPSLSGNTEYPQPSSGGFGAPRFIDFECRIREHLGIGAVYSHASIRRTMGYHDPLQFLHVNTQVDTVGVTGTGVCGRPSVPPGTSP